VVEQKQTLLDAEAQRLEQLEGQHGIVVRLEEALGHLGDVVPREIPDAVRE
jgi:hypothetical protein